MELVKYLAVWYTVTGMLITVLACYLDEDTVISVEEMVVTLFLWPMLFFIEHRDRGGWKGVIKTGFMDDKKGFFVRLLIMLLCLVILFSLVNFIENTLL